MLAPDLPMRYPTDDLRIRRIQELSPPAQLHSEFPISEAASRTVYQARTEIHRILREEDDRLLVIVGPCSIHDTEAALDYAQSLGAVRAALQADLMIVMRVYFEKPRT